MEKKIMKNLVLSPDYEKIFKNRLVLITGVSRSGTSTLGKIVGSMKNVIYLFEPFIMLLLPILAKDGFMDFKIVSQLLKGILFEDYYLHSIHGRNLNFKKSDISFIENYQPLDKVKERWLKYERRKDVLEDVYNGKFIFVLKVTNQIQPLLSTLEKMFEGIKIIHIIRNGNEVISSSLRRGWYSDEYLNHHIIQWMRPEQKKVPWFVPDEDVKKFRKWNSETIIAYIWRILVKMAMDYGKGKKNYLELRYENLVNDPEKIADICREFLGSEKTEITSKNIMAVKKHIPRQHTDQSENIDIEERQLFKKFMRGLNY